MKLTRPIVPRIFGLRLLIAVLAGLFFATATAGATALISQGFLTNADISPGSIVSLRKGSGEYVDTTTISNSDNILGVTIDGGNQPVSISTGQANQVQVATSGVEQVLVSDINGKIGTGDPVTASPISGVGMKASSNAKVVGIAQDTFPNSSSSKQTYTDKSGQKHTVELGEVPVLINVSYFFKQPAKTLIPQAIQNIANSLAGRTVNTLPILISIGIFIVMLIIVVSIVYSMIHSSIIAVGRNPMSQAAVYRNLIQLSSLVIIILMIGFGSIFMVLRKF